MHIYLSINIINDVRIVKIKIEYKQKHLFYINVAVEYQLQRSETTNIMQATVIIIPIALRISTFQLYLMILYIYAINILVVLSIIMIPTDLHNINEDTKHNCAKNTNKPEYGIDSNNT